jgi:surface antigen
MRAKTWTAWGATCALAMLASAQVHALPNPDSPLAFSHLECVPVARALSGIQIRGDAYTWWGQAEGHYDRGHHPRRGAVLAFKPHGGMILGHVATVSRIVDDRTILVTHSNWSLIGGRRGQIERDVKVIDVSPAGDWSLVRVWYDPSQDLGTTNWPVHGFIYPDGAPPMRLTGLGSPTVVPASLADVPVRPTGNINYLGRILKSLR